MNLNDDVKEWKKRLEEGKVFDKETIVEMIEIIEGQQNEIDWLRSM